MAKRVVKVFSPKPEQLFYARFSNSKGIAICIKPIPDRSGSYWVEKHLIEKYKEVQFLRVDQSKKDTPTNRVVFNEYDAQAKCFEMYEMFYNKNN